MSCDVKQENSPGGILVNTQCVLETKPNQEYTYRKKKYGYETLLILFLFLGFF